MGRAVAIAKIGGQMEPVDIKIGDHVRKGIKVYVTVSGPVEDIFQATDENGQTVSLSTQEVLRVRFADDDSAR